MRRWPAGALALMLGACSQQRAPDFEASVGWVERGAELGLEQALWSGGPHKHHIRQTLGQGLAWLDVEGDGDLDLFAPNGPRSFAGPGAHPPSEPWRLWVNEGGRFEERAREAGLDVGAWGIGCAVGDVDGDGLPDLFVGIADGPERLLLNRGGTFEEAGPDCGIGDVGLATGAAMADLDGDSDLDLVVAVYLDEDSPPLGPCTWKGADVMCGPKGFPPMAARLFLNDGAGCFQPSPALDGHSGYGLGVLCFDADDDGDQDVFVACDSGPNLLFVQEVGGRFRERAGLAGLQLGPSGRSQGCMGVDAADLDGDARIDLVVTNFSDDSNAQYRNLGGGFFRDVSDRSGLAATSFTRLGWSILGEDFDLDGDLDLFVANGHVYPQAASHDPGSGYEQPLQLLFNDGSGRWGEDPERCGPAFSLPRLARGAAAADFDGDGDLDLAVTRDGAPPLLFENRLPAPAARGLTVELVDGGANPRAIGARLELRQAGRVQVRELRRSRGYLSSGAASATFGVGPGPVRLEVRWPDGEETAHELDESGGRWVVRRGGPRAVAPEPGAAN